MGLWLLRPRDGLPDTDNPWKPWYDKTFGFVVRAETEERARELAHKHGGAENRGEFLRKQIALTTSPWLDSKYSTCTILDVNGHEEVIIEDTHSA